MGPAFACRHSPHNHTAGQASSATPLREFRGMRNQSRDYRIGHRPALHRRTVRSGGHLLVALVLALFVAAAPDSLVVGTKDLARRVLAPGRRVCKAVEARITQSTAMFTTHAQLVEQLAARDARLAALARQNAQLRSSLAVAALHSTTATGEANSDSWPDSAPFAPSLIKTAPLVEPRRVQARVLGRQARAYLAACEVLDAGAEAGLSPGDLVLETATDALDVVPLVDQGRNVGLGDGDLVLQGRHVWGRLVEVGPQTATVRRVWEAGYRDLVQLAHVQDGRLRLGPRGVLEGHGERECRIQLVDVTQPVAVGDWVLAAAEDGVLESPPVYGTVVDVQRTAGGSHWEIWMKPAADSATSDTVEVVSLRLNPQRTVAADMQPASYRR